MGFRETHLNKKPTQSFETIQKFSFSHGRIVIIFGIKMNFHACR
jgi:hypothetical protein